MVTTRAIRVDEDVYRSLQGKARAFEDTPNSVLRRLLDLGDESPDQKAAPASGGPVPRPLKENGRRSGEERTPQSAFRRPILEAIKELGGKGRVADVLKRAEQKMTALTPLDRSVVKSGDPRWKVYARFERLSMRHEGLLRGEHGYWEITDKGRAYLKESTR